MNVEPDDIMRKIRIRKNSSLIIFVVDLSWSMSVTQRLEATRRAVSGILAKAYQYRDDICLITFQGELASVVIQPSHSITLAEKAMKNMQAGGKTPLTAGLKKAEEIVKREISTYGKENIFVVLLSDCEGNVSFSPENANYPQAEAESAADQIRKEGCKAIIINSDQMSFGQGYANQLAKHLNASCYLISGFNADRLIQTMRDEMIL